MVAATPTHHMAPAERLRYCIQSPELKNGQSNNKYAKSDLSYAYMQHHSCPNWQEAPTCSLPAKTHSNLQATI